MYYNLLIAYLLLGISVFAMDTQSMLSEPLLENDHLALQAPMLGKKEDIEKRFIEAAKQGSIESVEFYLKRQVNVHARQDKALRRAARNGHLQTVLLLLQYGANIHAKNKYALLWAQKNNHRAVAEHLITLSRDVHAVHKQQSQEVFSSPSESTCCCISCNLL